MHVLTRKIVRFYQLKRDFNNLGGDHPSRSGMVREERCGEKGQEKKGMRVVT
jgi:hypothetical protein